MSAHHHQHNHTQPKVFAAIGSKRIKQSFAIGIILNSAFVVSEFACGFYTNSLSLLSDAGHNLSDVAALSLSLFAFNLSNKKANNKFTFGYHKGTILASLANAVILLIAVGSIGWEAIQRLMHPEFTEGKIISLVAGAGILINVLSAFLFYREKETDLNLKTAYLHLATDALISAGVVVAGLLISYTGIVWIDPLVSLIVMFVVIYSTWSLLVESLNLSLDAVPAGIEVSVVKEQVLKNKSISTINHIHIWAMGTTRNAMTAHLTFKEGLNSNSIAQVKNELRHELEHLNIHHVTFETDENKHD